MCKWFFNLFKKSDTVAEPALPETPVLSAVDGSSPRTGEHTPSPAYLAGKMPTYDIPDLIKHLQFRIEIHESYWGLVEDDPVTWSPAVYGSVEYQLWAIEGYKNAIYYLER